MYKSLLLIILLIGVLQLSVSNEREGRKSNDNFSYNIGSVGVLISIILMVIICYITVFYGGWQQLIKTYKKL